MLKGIDVSSYQANLDYKLARNNGFEVCIIKATESLNYINPYLDSQVNNALSNGMKIGFYHFFRNIGIDEAKLFVNTIKPYKSKMTVKPVIDIEASYSFDNIIDFINHVEKALGVECMVYCNLSYAKLLSTNSEIAKRTLWIAYYGRNDGNYYQVPNDHNFNSFGGQQYSDVNSIGNVNVDMNLFNKNIFINGAVAAAPVTAPTSSVRKKNSDGTYTVKVGDTLSAIGDDFGISYLELARLNRIENPNIIHVGQVLNFVETGLYHIVKAGETLSAIGLKYGISYTKIAAQNGIVNPNLIYVGQKLRIK